jgi:hypothetical protein
MSARNEKTIPYIKVLANVLSFTWHSALLTNEAKNYRNISVLQLNSFDKMGGKSFWKPCLQEGRPYPQKEANPRMNELCLRRKGRDGRGPIRKKNLNWAEEADEHRLSSAGALRCTQISPSTDRTTREGRHRSHILKDKSIQSQETLTWRRLKISLLTWLVNAFTLRVPRDEMGGRIRAPLDTPPACLSDRSMPFVYSNEILCDSHGLWSETGLRLRATMRFVLSSHAERATGHR